MIDIAIIDDDKNFCKDFITKLSSINEEFETDCFYDAQSFIDNGKKYDIVFVDIMLNNTNGIDLAKKISHEQPSVKIIFLSTEKDFFQDVYSAEHVYFLVKPVSDKHLMNALELCCDEIDKQFIYVKNKSVTISIPLDKVAYFEGTLKKTVVHYIDMSTEIINKSLANIQGILKNTNFVRTHQSYIINMNSITQFTKKNVTMLNKDLPISRRYSESTAKNINRFLGIKISNSY